MSLVIGGVFFALIGVMQFWPYIHGRRSMKEPLPMKRQDEYHLVKIMPDYMNAKRCDRLRAIAFFCFIVVGIGGMLLPVADGDSVAAHLLQVVVVAAMAPALVGAFLIFFMVMPFVYAFGRPKWMTDQEWREIEGAAVRWWRKQKRTRS